VKVLSGKKAFLKAVRWGYLWPALIGMSIFAVVIYFFGFSFVSFFLSFFVCVAIVETLIMFLSGSDIFKEDSK